MAVEVEKHHHTTITEQPDAALYDAMENWTSRVNPVASWICLFGIFLLLCFTLFVVGSARAVCDPFVTMGTPCLCAGRKQYKSESDFSATRYIIRVGFGKAKKKWPLVTMVALGSWPQKRANETKRKGKKQSCPGQSTTKLGPWLSVCLSAVCWRIRNYTLRE